VLSETYIGNRNSLTVLVLCIRHTILEDLAELEGDSAADYMRYEPVLDDPSKRSLCRHISEPICA
jgi:hypothetical protein